MHEMKKNKNKTAELRDPKYYINRELSWMQFDERILEEARDPSFLFLKDLNSCPSLHRTWMNSS